MNKDALYNQLLSIRSAIDAALCILGEEGPEEPQACPHPPDKRKNHSTMGRTIWQCGLCGYLHEEVNQAGGTDMEKL